MCKIASGIKLTVTEYQQSNSNRIIIYYIATQNYIKYSVAVQGSTCCAMPVFHELLEYSNWKKSADWFGIPQDLSL